MVSWCRFCTTYKIHGQCMWFGNLNYFTAALMLFQVAVVQQNKSDPSTLQEPGRDVLASHWRHRTCWIRRYKTAVAHINGFIFISRKHIFQLNNWSVPPISQITYFVWSRATLRSAGRVVRGAREHQGILPAAGRLSKWHFLLQWKRERCAIRDRKCTLRN